MIATLFMPALLAATSALPAGEDTAAPATTQDTLRAGTVDPDLVGHYYLSGVMETGSELLLRADGSYEWFISYGAVDQLSSGRWGRSGGQVLLVADQPAADAPLFRADERFAWDRAAEQHLLDARHARQEEEIARRCPWQVAVVAAAPPIMLDPPAPTEEDRRAAAEGLSQVARLRDQANAAVRASAADTADDALREAASDAVGRWHQARYDMEQAHREARLPVPQTADLFQPPQCTVDRARAPEAAARWQRGIAVVVGDPQVELRLSSVTVTFTRADGQMTTDVTGPGGLAFAPFVPGSPVVAIDLRLDAGGEVPLHGRIDIPPIEQGVQTVRVDTRQLVEPAFATLRLQVEGRDLVPLDMPRGRYSRP